jgi:hypothetical protein
MLYGRRVADPGHHHLRRGVVITSESLQMALLQIKQLR